MIKRYTLACLILVLYSCKNDSYSKESFTSKNSKSVNSNEEQFKSIETLLKITSLDDHKALNFINLTTHRDLYGHNQKFHGVKKETNQIQFKLKSFSTPQILDLTVFGKQGYHNKLFVSPGDTINIHLERGKIIVFGSVENRFFSESNISKVYYPTYHSNPDLYKSECKKIYSSKKRILKNFLNKEKSVSKVFVKKIHNHLEHEYRYNLIAPRSLKAKCTNTFYNTSTSIFSLLGNVKNEEKELFDSKIYFDHITIQTFKNKIDLDNDYYKRSLIEYIRFYFSNVHPDYYNVPNYLSEKEYINKNLKDKLKDFALARLFADYARKGNKNNSLLNLELQKLKKELSKNNNFEYVTEIDSIYNTINQRKKELDSVFLNLDVENIYGDHLKIKDPIFNSNKMILLYFWGSWCSPCVNDLENLKLFYNKNRKSVEIIGVSFRDSKNNWKQTISSKKLDWPQLFNSDLNAHKKLGVTVFPTKILIDTNKRIINVYQGNSKKFYTEINSFLKGD